MPDASDAVLATNLGDLIRQVISTVDLQPWGLGPMDAGPASASPCARSMIGAHLGSPRPAY